MGLDGPARQLPLHMEQERSISNGVSGDGHVIFVGADAHPRVDSRGPLIFPSLGFVDSAGTHWNPLSDPW